MPADRVLFLPLNRLNQGTGHMRRCYETAGRLGVETGIILENKCSDVRDSAGWAAEIPGFPGSIPLVSCHDGLKNGPSETASDEVPGFYRTLLVFDRRSSDMEDLSPWVNRACPILLDDDGPARRIAPFVIDTIPGPRRSEANIDSPAWLNLPPRSRQPDPEGPILVSFGGDDPSGLTIPVTRALVDQIGISPDRIKVTLPQNASAENLPPAVGVLELDGDLKTRLGDFGLVICSYGLTAWESIAAGAAVITADPSEYHAQLSKINLFPGIGRVSVGRILASVEIETLKLVLEDKISLIESAEKLSQVLGEDFQSKDVASLYSSLDAPKPVCAACGSLLPPVIARFPRRSYYLCPDCGITGLYRFEMKENEYGPSYFQKEYKDQYGRSYLEDFSYIKKMARARLAAISLKAEKGASLLDIGCAFGPFLDASREAGYRPFGTDISPEAVAYVNENLKIPAFSGSFPSDNPAEVLGMDRFDVVTLWYVIEHFSDLKSVLVALNNLLVPGGVLALSTPNGRGISGRRSFRGFLENSPVDHYSIWSPGVSRRLLRRFGFRVYRIRVTGHHPERFRFRFFGRFSRVLRFGDTFEIYAVKEKSID